MSLLGFFLSDILQAYGESSLIGNYLLRKGIRVWTTNKEASMYVLILTDYMLVDNITL